MEIENHPIPQDITGFKFKLIGSMTIKQFAYLAAGFIVAWVIYISSIFFPIRVAIAFLFAATGAVFAFVPLLGRPLDVTILNFFRAVSRPTQYVYQQYNIATTENEAKSIHSFNKKRQTIAEMSEKQLQEFLSNLPKTTNKLDKKELVFFQNINQIQKASVQTQQLPQALPQHAFANQAPTTVSENTLPPVRQDQLKPSAPTLPPNPIPDESLQKTAVLLQQELQTAKKEESLKADTGSKDFLEAHEKVLELQKNLNEMLISKQQLEEKLTQLQKQVSTQTKQVYSPSTATQPQQTQFVRSVPQNMTKGVGLISAPEFPNVISGIVKDPRGNPLANILVEVKDGQGNAVRAFKTNALGQYISATALSNGDYTIEFDDPKGQNKFDTVGFKATGEIILPIEVISVDTREELRRSLFN